MDPADIENRFAFHKANDITGPKHEQVRAVFKAIAGELDDLLPDGREKSSMMSSLEVGMFWANAAIARTEGG